MGRAGRQPLVRQICDFAWPVVTTAALLPRSHPAAPLQGSQWAGAGGQPMDRGSCIWVGLMSVVLAARLGQRQVRKCQCHQAAWCAMVSQRSSRPGLNSKTWAPGMVNPPPHQLQKDHCEVCKINASCALLVSQGEDFQTCPRIRILDLLLL